MCSIVLLAACGVEEKKNNYTIEDLEFGKMNGLLALRLMYFHTEGGTFVDKEIYIKYKKTSEKEDTLTVIETESFLSEKTDLIYNISEDNFNEFSKLYAKEFSKTLQVEEE